jgi:outer membrane protein OmpA-like peptidoglycan-associated protein
MKNSFRLIFAFALLMPAFLPLTACSYLNKDDDLENAPAVEQASETIDLTSDAKAVPVENMTPIVSDRFNGTTYSLEPSVEIFPLDDDMARTLPRPVSAAAPMSQNAVSVSDLSSDNGSMAPVISQNGAQAVVYFEHGSTRLDNAARQVVTEVAAANPSRLSVEGHASSVSSIEDPVKRKIVNLKVSMDRALSVARALIEKGVPADNITTVAHGEAHPGATAAQSRRVEISSAPR